MNFREDDKTLSFIESQIAKAPSSNVMSKEAFQERVYMVFEDLAGVLIRSFGPGGAPTFVSTYPNYYATKDGFNIAKNVGYDTQLDQTICDMIMRVSTKLNFTVGDGTSSAIIITYLIYKAYLDMKEWFDRSNILPRDIMRVIEEFKQIILNHINTSTKHINISNVDELEAAMRQVAFISSNGDEEITNIVANMYRELRHPSIICKPSDDGITRGYVINGFKAKIRLIDALYINSANNMLIDNHVDVIMFDHKVGDRTYREIIEPLSNTCKQRQRRLLVIAPSYDEISFQIIAQELHGEFQREKTINTIFTTASVYGPDRGTYNDLAVLLNTRILTNAVVENMIQTKSSADLNINQLFNIDGRGIEGINVVTYHNDDTTKGFIDRFNEKKEYIGNDNKIHEYKLIYPNEDCIKLGHIDEVNLSLDKDSTFKGFHYDENMYKLALENARQELEEIFRKSEQSGVFSVNILEKQQRYYALELKTGIIEYSGGSELATNYMKDVMDDVIRATSSAYFNGLVPGCGVTILQAINELKNSTEFDKDLDKKILDILYNGFSGVTEILMYNSAKDRLVNIDDGIFDLDKRYPHILSIFKDLVDGEVDDINIIDRDVFDNMHEHIEDTSSLSGYVVAYQIETGLVYDVSKGIFTDKIVNSSQTDSEILKASIDLLSLLITGSQLIMR